MAMMLNAYLQWLRFRQDGSETAAAWAQKAAAVTAANTAYECESAHAYSP